MIDSTNGKPSTEIPFGRLRVIAPVDHLRLTNSNLIDGEIWLETDDGRAFPREGWFDFSARLLGQWVQDFSSSIEGSFRELRFWDGPQAARIANTGSRAWTIEFFPRGFAQYSNGAPFEFEAETFLASLRHAARQTLENCEQRALESEDLALLRAYRRRLENQ